MDKHVHSTLLFCLIWAVVSCTPHSSTEFFHDDLDFAIHEVEYHYAGFPLLTEEELAEYEVMKAAVRDSVDAGAYLDYEAVGHYLAWFQNAHLRSCYIEQTNLWKHDVDYSSLFSYAPKKLSCIVDDETYLIRFPSCSGDPDEQWVSQSVQDFQKSDCRFLILDIRGNGGGNDRYFEPYLELLYDTPAEVEGNDLFYTKKNFNFLREHLPQIKRLARFRDKQKERVMWPFVDDVFFELPSVSERPVAAALIIDNAVASAGEKLTLILRAISKRTTIYGRENTYGCLDISNIRPVNLPYSGITIHIPTTVSHRLPDRGIDKEGISPDVRLDIPYPTELTDNIDEWVLWIAQDLKKKASNGSVF